MKTLISYKTSTIRKKKTMSLQESLFNALITSTNISMALCSYGIKRSMDSEATLSAMLALKDIMMERK